MAFDEKLAQRVRALLAGKKGISEKKMFGGIAFLLSGKMCCGVLNDDLVARVSVEDYAAALGKRNVRPMDFTGRPMKGFLYVSPAALLTSRALQAWLDQSTRFIDSLPAKKRPKNTARGPRG